MSELLQMGFTADVPRKHSISFHNGEGEEVVSIDQDGLFTHRGESIHGARAIYEALCDSFNVRPVPLDLDGDLRDLLSRHGLTEGQLVSHLQARGLE